jgi:transaldolase/transaldolase/glucose-6-phosphate isomerase
VNTLPLETLEAYRDHGNPALRLTEGLAEAHQVLQNLAVLRIDLDRMAQQLEDEGVQKFQKPFDQLLARLASSPRGTCVRI